MGLAAREAGPENQDATIAPDGQGARASAPDGDGAIAPERRPARRRHGRGQGLRLAAALRVGAVPDEGEVGGHGQATRIGW